MSKTTKFLEITTAALSGFFSLFLLLFLVLFPVPDAKARAEDEDGIVVLTTQYSILSPSVFVLGGAYSGNVDKKPFTTYFEYKRATSDDDSRDLDIAEDREQTIEIERETNIDWGPLSVGGESGEFYSSPSLQLNSTYYFRAVGFFSDDESQKFYGRTFSFRTGFPYPADASFPFSAYPNGNVISYTPDSCASSRDLTDGDCINKTPPNCNLDRYDLVNGLCKSKISPDCEPPQVLNPSTNACVTHGGWSAWNPPACPSACGQPASTLTRACTNPPVANGGNLCTADGSSYTKDCPATEACAPEPTPTPT